VIELLKADNGSAIVNANIVDGAINAGLVVVTPLSGNSLIFRGEFDDYLIELPEELANQGVTSSLVDIDLPFSIA
jgi:hypothetical protein